METITFREHRARIVPSVLGWLVFCLPSLGICEVAIHMIIADHGLGPRHPWQELAAYVLLFALTAAFCVGLARSTLRLIHPGEIKLTARHISYTTLGKSLLIDWSALGVATQESIGGRGARRDVIHMARIDGGRPLQLDVRWYAARLATIHDAIRAIRRGTPVQPAPQGVPWFYIWLWTPFLALVLWCEISVLLVF